MQLDIPPGPFAGYIFDLDGTLIDSMPVHYRAWDAAMHQFGLNQPLDPDFFYSMGGVPTVRVAELIAQRFRKAHSRLGFGRLPPLDTSAFVPPRPPSPQGELF